MKKILLITLILILSAGGYYYYQEYYLTQNQDIWDLVPAKTLMVYESSTPASSYNELVASKTGANMLDIAEFSKFNLGLNHLDTIGGKEGTLGTLLKGKVLLSFQSVSKNELGVAFFKLFEAEDQKQSFTRIIDYYKNKPDYNLTTRNYQGELIYELTDKTSGKTFSYFFSENVLVASFIPFLVEDVIRLTNDGNLNSFKSVNQNLFELPKLSNDAGNLYINTSSINQLLKLFSPAKDLQIIDGELAKSTFFDVNIDDQGVYFNGFTEYKATNFLSIFEGQSAQATSIKYYIPNQAITHLEFTFSDYQTLYNRLSDYIVKNNPQLARKIAEYRNTFSMADANGFSWLGKSMSLVTLDDNEGQLLYVDASDVNEALNELNTLGESIAEADGDSVYVENYSTYEIREINSKNFTKYQLMPYMKETEVTFYMLLENFVVFGSSIQSLKQLADAIEQENTWGRSVTYNSFLERTLEEANISYEVNTEKFFEQAIGDLDPNWGEFIQENLNVLRNYNLMSFQLSKLDENFYTSFVMGFEKRKTATALALELEQKVNIGELIISKPFVVKNHISNLREVVVMDSSHQLVLISSEGNILWKKQIGQPIVGELVQIDYYKNNKLQYFFTTPSAIHIIDRNGNYIEGFPKATNEAIHYSNVIDYDNTKNYRFLTADNRGNIYLYNKEGQVLNGWTPNALNGQLTHAPFHVRVRKKDCFVVGMKDGKVLLINRRGKLLSGFPLELNDRLDATISVTIGADISSTLFTTITREGRLVRFTMDGQIVETNQLYKPTKESRFSIINDALGKSFIIVRKDKNRVVMLDASGKEILAKDYIDAEDMVVQYYDFNSADKLYTVTDRIQGFTYLYNKDGKLLSSRPISSEFEVGVIFSEIRDNLKVFYASDSTFKIIEFK